MKNEKKNPIAIVDVKIHYPEDFTEENMGEYEKWLDQNMQRVIAHNLFVLSMQLEYLNKNIEYWVGTVKRMQMNAAVVGSMNQMREKIKG